MQKLHKNTPTQREPLRSDQSPNNAGGFAWTLGTLERLRRFLILGTEGGTYYVGQRELERSNIDMIDEAIREDGNAVLDLVLEVSEGGLAYKQDYTLFVLAKLLASDDLAVKRSAARSLNRIVRTGTHLFMLVEYVNSLRGWGRLLRDAIGSFYEFRKLEDLEYQLIKYGQRHGWSHQDVLRKAHPPLGGERSTLIEYFLSREPDADLELRATMFERMRAARKIRALTKAEDVAALIRKHNLPREVVPTQHLRDPLVWSALLERMPLMATIRNLATMTRVGLLTGMSEATDIIAGRLNDEDYLKRSRIHPMHVLAALMTYSAGRSGRGSSEWEPVGQVVDALDRAFYKTFANVQPSGMRTLLALDVSGSMGWSNLMGVPELTPRVASAALALVTAATEPKYDIVAFSGSLVRLAISPNQRLDDVLRIVDATPMGGTDCALPMAESLKRKWDVESFVIYTDSETWARSEHPSAALQRYRREVGINSTCVVVGMTATAFSIADPKDPRMLDVVGFDPGVPALINDFARQP